MNTKIIKRVWRHKKVNVIRDEKHRLSLSTFGAIVEFKELKYFIDLADIGDEERFEKFIAEEDMSSRYVIENTLQEQFVCTDYEENDEMYTYTKGGELL